MYIMITYKKCVYIISNKIYEFVFNTQLILTENITDDRTCELKTKQYYNLNIIIRPLAKINFYTCQ